MNRRAFLMALGLLPAIVWIPADAQQPMPKIGVLLTRSSAESFYQAFLAGLKDLGYVEGKNIQIESARGEIERLAELSQQLARANVSLVFAPTPQTVQAMRKASPMMPIVFAVGGDPVGTGLAKSLARPGGNTTGLTALGSSLSGKRLDLLKDVVPKLSRVAVLWNPAVADKVIEWKQLQTTAGTLKIELISLEVRTVADFPAALEHAKRSRAEALIALGEPLVFGQKDRVIEFATRARIPSMFNWREAAEGGALIAYGPNIADLYRRAALYVDKILKGARPGDLPIEEASRFDFVVNLKTAKAFGVTIPQSILLRADKVIE